MAVAIIWMFGGGDRELSKTSYEGNFRYEFSPDHKVFKITPQQESTTIHSSLIIILKMFERVLQVQDLQERNTLSRYYVAREKT